MNKPHVPLCEQAEVYVLGGLNSKEEEEYMKHLATCSDCQQKVKELEEIADLLPMGAEVVEVPAGMKDRVLKHVLQNKSDSEAVQSSPPAPIAETPIPKKSTTVRPMNWMRNTVVAGLAAAIVILMFYSFELNQQIGQLQAEIKKGQPENQQPQQLYQAVSLSPATEDIIANGLATIIIDSKGTHLLIQAEDLPELQGTEAYQVWLIKEGEPLPRSAGTFLTEQGNGALYYTFEPQQYDQIAITLEPDASGEQPRGDIILAASLQADSNAES